MIFRVFNEAPRQMYMCGHEGLVPRFLKLGTNRGREISFSPLLLYLKRGSSVVIRTAGLVGTGIDVGVVEL